MRIMNRFRSRIHMCILLTTVWFIGVIMAQAQTTNSSCIIEVSMAGAQVAPISRGQQIEEFNHQFMGGLYAQLINNPSFEEIKKPTSAWSIVKKGSSGGKLLSQTPKETPLLNKFQEHCIKLEVSSVANGEVGLANSGYWGIGLKNNTLYKISFWAKKGENFKGTVKASLESNDGKVYSQSQKLQLSTEWKHFTCDLTTAGIAKEESYNRFVIYASSTGDVYFDVVTVMPPTWKNRPNGLRIDLAERLDALKMKFIQFPGGCASESASMDTCWNWKNSIGPLEERPGSTRQRWHYKNDLYFGLDEYFQLCEDMGAEPVYTTSDGISEVSWDTAWFSICPLAKMKPIVDDIMDLLEYCNGPVTSVWGAKRAANGHPKPYNLKYLEIGNEHGYDKVKEYGERYTMIRNTIIARYPYMKFMYDGWPRNNILSNTFGNEVDFTDDHFYSKSFTHLYHKYDTIDPSNKKICIAEYANSVHGNGGDVVGNYGDALEDAVFMLGCEKNSERMWWTGYGNYGSLIGHGDFGPCIVWNDAVSNFVTPSYHMQKMLFTDNEGSRVLPFTQNTPECFWSATVDTSAGKNDILLKVANKSVKTTTVDITLKGAGKVNPVGLFYYLMGDLEAENSIKNPDNIIPIKGTFVASDNFSYSFPALSITVLRISN